MKRALLHAAKSVLPFELRYAVRRLDWRRRYLAAYLAPGAGGPVFCPVADRQFHHFARTRRGGLLTPSNGAQARHRLIWLYLQRETRLFEGGKSLLHVAPERCLMTRFQQAPGLLYVPGDKMANGYGAQSGVRPLDLLAIDYPDGTFDYLLCNHVLEHVPDDGRAIAEMFRVLKPGGAALVTVPLRRGATLEDPAVQSPAERERLFGQWDHVRYYGEDITTRFEQAGFVARLVRYADRFPAREQQRLGLDRTVILHADKPA